MIDATPGRQTLSCFEGKNEVYFCRISSGYGETFSTPLGDQAISWKIFSIHMAANTGSDSGYDTMAVPWPVFFNTNAGAAIHGVFWHNDFGVQAFAWLRQCLARGRQMDLPLDFSIDFTWTRAKWPAIPE